VVKLDDIPSSVSVACLTVGVNSLNVVLWNLVAVLAERGNRCVDSVGVAVAASKQSMFALNGETVVAVMAVITLIGLNNIRLTHSSMDYPWVAVSAENTVLNVHIVADIHIDINDVLRILVTLQARLICDTDIGPDGNLVFPSNMSYEFSQCPHFGVDEAPYTGLRVAV
jgi:hypothetical protein